VIFPSEITPKRMGFVHRAKDLTVTCQRHAFLD
jgi:hypothetical protein